MTRQKRATRPWLRNIFRLLLALVLSVLVFALGVILAYRPAFGASAEGERLAQMKHSPQFGEGVFHNPQPLWNDTSLSSLVTAISNRSEVASPSNPAEDIPIVRGDGSAYDTPPETGLRVTWFGHSSVLVEIDGTRVLTDPVWGPTASPVPWLGPGRWYEPPVALDDLPSIDAVVISHDHYDHLDYATFQIIKSWDTTFYVPLGVGAHLALWGVPEARIVELDWWEQRRLGDLTMVCTPARHASGRKVYDQNATLWAGWAIVGPQHRVFFSGDTGLFDDMKKIGTEYGPFDLTMIEVGAYDRAWPDWHIGPEQAVLAHQWLRGEVFLPVHWGLFDLAFHGWTEPAERALAAAKGANVRIVVPRPGERIEPATVAGSAQWWPEVPWQTAQEHPVVSTAANGVPPRD